MKACKGEAYGDSNVIEKPPLAIQGDRITEFACLLAIYRVYQVTRKGISLGLK